MFPDGEDPDPRFTLANERTFLSWIRTALAFIGGGIAVEAFTGEIFSPGLRATLSIVLMAIGFVLAAGAAFRWYRIEAAMRRKQSRARAAHHPHRQPRLGTGSGTARPRLRRSAVSAPRLAPHETPACGRSARPSRGRARV